MRMTNPIAYLLPFLLLCSNGTNAQLTDNTRFIEITVTDTLNILPDVLEYTVRLRLEKAYPAYEPNSYGTNNHDYALDRKKREEENNVKMQVMEKRFMDLLSKEKISYTRGTNSKKSFNVYDEYDTKDIKPFVITFSSFEKAGQFQEKIPRDIQYDINLTNMAYTKYEQSEARLMEKVLAKAKKQAQQLATLSNVKLGHLMQFSDNTDNNIVKGIEQLITTFMNKYEREKFYELYKNMNLSKTVRVRYAIE